MKKGKKKEMDQKTKKTSTIRPSMDPKGDADRQHWTEKEGDKGLVGVQDVIKIEENGMGIYIEDKEEKLLAEAFREGLFDNNEVKRNQSPTLAILGKYDDAHLRFTSLWATNCACRVNATVGGWPPGGIKFPSHVLS